MAYVGDAAEEYHIKQIPHDRCKNTKGKQKPQINRGELKFHLQRPADLKPKKLPKISDDDNADDGSWTT